MFNLKNNQSFFYFFSLLSLIITLQTVYPNSEILRLFHRNLTGYCLFPFHSDKASVARLGKKLFPTSSKWFMNAYEHATQVTKNGYLYVDTSNESGLKEKFRIRNFIAPIFTKTLTLQPSQQQQQQQPLSDEIRAVAKKDHQYLYADLNTETPTYQ